MSGSLGSETVCYSGWMGSGCLQTVSGGRDPTRPCQRYVHAQLYGRVGGLMGTGAVLALVAVPLWPSPAAIALLGAGFLVGYVRGAGAL